ncbi:MAG: 30S ribosomal protein S18 [Oscillospiraceae bacterium]
MEKTNERNEQRSDRSDRSDRSERPERKFQNRRSRRKVCAFCIDRAEFIEYKDISKLRKFMTERAKIMPRRMTGTCSKHQRELTVAIKKARHVALLPFVTE